jgi:drug/metabolite transporter (DMT)-like permease
VTKKGKAEWFLFATTFLWAGTFVIVKQGLSDLSPFVFVALRFSIATIFLLPFCKKSLFRMDGTVVWKGFGLGSLIFLGFILQTVGLNYTSASKSAFITSMMVIFTPFFQLLLLKRPPRWGNLIGVAAVSFGLWFLTAPTEGGINRGDLFTLLCAIVFGLHIVSLDLVSRKHDTLQVTFLQMFYPALFGWMALPFFERPLFRPTAGAFIALGYTALLATIVTTYIQTRYQPDTTPTRAALIFSLEPLWVAMLGYLFLHEVLGPFGLLGGGLIIGGILFSVLSNAMRARWQQLLRTVE